MKGHLVSLPFSSLDIPDPKDACRGTLIEPGGETTIGGETFSWDLPEHIAECTELVALTLVLDSGQDFVFAVREIRIAGDVIAKYPITPRKDPAFMKQIQRDEQSSFVDLAKPPGSERYVPLQKVGRRWQGFEVTLRNTSGDGAHNGSLSRAVLQKVVGVPVAFHGILLCCAR